MRHLLAALLVLAAWPAFAQTGTAALSCTAPTQYTDGTAIGSAAISYRFYRGTTAASQTTASPVQNACSYTFTGLAAGTHYFSVTAIVGGQESAKTAAVSKVIAPPVPSPPTGLTVAQDLTAWTIVTTDGAIVALEVGRVAPGTACDSAQSVTPYGLGKTLYHVPESSVTFLPGATAIVTVAECSGG